MKNLTFKQLRTLKSVAHTGSVTAASEELDVTPPAVTLQLQQLEEQVLDNFTIYDISFIRLSDPPNTQFKSLRTLNEGPVDTLANSIVLNTGMGGNTLVLDLENSISTPNIVENRFVFDNAPDATISTSQTNIIDITLPDGSAVGDDLSGTIRTIYKSTPIQLTSPYVLYSTPVDGYISESLSFTVEQMKIAKPYLYGLGNFSHFCCNDTGAMYRTKLNKKFDF